MIVDTFKGGNGSISSPDFPLGSDGMGPVQYTDDSAPVVFDFSLLGIVALQAREAASRWLEKDESTSQSHLLSGYGNRPYNGIPYNW
jgi:hypothetical protein